MSRLQNVAITLLFIINAYSALGTNLSKKLPDSDVDINNKSVPVPPITVINGDTTTTESPVNPKENSTTVATTTPAVPTVPTNQTTLPPKPTTPITPKTTPATTIEPLTSTPNPNITTTANPNITTTASPNITTTVKPPVTSVKPTLAPPTTPVPSHRRFDGPSFIGGIVLALGLVAIGFVAFKFYKARTELNYHTL